MKRILLAFGACVFSGSLLMAAGWQAGEGRGDWEGKDRGGYAPRPRVVIKMRRYSVPRPNAIRSPEHIVRDDRRANLPERDEHGVAIGGRRAILPPAHHTAVMQNQALVNNITTRERVEVVPNRYYWHTDGGIRYAHYCDHGIHWYGFYHGPTFYWTRYYYNRWWWFDVGFGRWVYWWDGYWWWAGPGGTAYIYVDNNYYPYQEGVVTVANPEVQAPPVAQPAMSEGNAWSSPDGTRMVQIYGADSEAFLYDKTAARPAYIAFLGRGVQQVRYSGGKDGRPLQVLLDFKDGAFAVFDGNGNPLDSPTAAASNNTQTTTAQPPAAPPAPTEMPPMPTSAPGEAPAGSATPAASGQPPAAPASGQ